MKVNFSLQEYNTITTTKYHIVIYLQEYNFKFFEANDLKEM